MSTLRIPYRVSDLDSTGLQVTFHIVSTDGYDQSPTVTASANDTWLNFDQIVPGDSTYTVTATVSDGANASTPVVSSPVYVPTGATATVPWIGGNTTWYVDWTHISPLNNVWKQARDPRRAAVSTIGTQTWDDNDELLTNTGSIQTVLWPDWTTHPYGTYVVEWTGPGSIQVDSTQIAASGGTVDIPIGSNGVYITLNGVCTAIKIYKQGSDPAGFDPTWLSEMGIYGAIRFMDLMTTNSSMVQTADDLPTEADSTYTRTIPYTLDGTSPDVAFYPNMGVPVETCCKLAKAANCVPWLNVPHAADDACMAEFANRVKAEMGSSKVIIEYSNECWNFAPAFQQSPYCYNRGNETFGTSGNYNSGFKWYVKRAAECSQIMRNAGINVDFVLAWQKLSEYWTFETVLLQYATDNNLLDMFDAFSVSGYYGTYPGTTDVEEYFSTVQTAIDDCKAEWVPFKAICDANGKKFFVYEGHWGGYGNTDVLLDSRHRTALGNHFQTALDVGIDLYMLYTSIAYNGPTEGWGALQYQGQPDTPAVDAVNDYRGSKNANI